MERQADEPESYSAARAARFERASQVFEGARALRADARAAYLDDACGGDAELRREVEDLLSFSEDRGDALDEGRSALDSDWARAALANTVQSNDAPPVPARAPAAIPGYEVLSPLGAGGMGQVFLARRTGVDFEQRVAIKLLRGELTDPAAEARFVEERRILAGLEHPNIARLLDGGTTEAGTPYLVMEHVDGRGLIEHCAQHGLDVAARLRLMIRIGHAVTALHQRLIVHRDLKPSNILVTEDGTPKLLDFGIAKLLEAEGAGPSAIRTQTGMALYTPEYASPEQSQGLAITTASDVYSLGVLLFEMLTEERPYQFTTRSALEFERVLTGVQPAPMSSVAGPFARACRGDLDTIAAMALRKEPERRYPSVAAFTRDLERHLEGLPVHARPDTFGYRASKFVRRRFGWVAAAALFLVTLTAFTVTTIRQAREVERERDAANVRAQVSDEVSRFLVELFRVASPDEAVGEHLTAKTLLDRGATEIRYGVRTDPRVRAALLEAMGVAHFALGSNEKAASLLADAIALADADATGVLDAAIARAHMGMVRFDEGDNDEAERMMRAALDESRRRHAAPHAETARVQMILARHLANMGQNDEGLAEAEAAHALLAALPESPRRDLARSLVERARIHEARGDYERAEELLLEARADQAALFEGDHPDQASTARALGLLYETLGRYADGMREVETALRIDREVMGESHPDVDFDLYSLATLSSKAGDLDRALALSRDVLARDRERYGDHYYVSLDLGSIANILSRQGNFEGAGAHFEESLALQRRVLPERHPEIATTLSNMAAMLRRKGEPAAMLPLVRESLAIREASFPPDHPAVLTSRNMLASALQDTGELEAALPEAQEVLELRRKRLGAHRSVAGSLLTVGTILAGLDRDAEALPLLEESLAMYRDQLAVGHLDIANPLMQLAMLRIREGSPDRARALLEEALSIRERKLTAEHPNVVAARELLRSLE